jgi:hypothetical protein
MKGTNHDVIQVMITVQGRCEAQTVITNAQSTKLFGAEASVCRSGAKYCLVIAPHTPQYEDDGKPPSVQLAQTVRAADSSGAPVTSA